MTNSLPKILITGSQGQLGSALNQQADKQAFNLCNTTHASLDISDEVAFTQAIKYYQPQLIVNTAAYTAVDKAETEQEQCMLVNFHACKNLARVCTQFNIPLIHISTDYIFDGEKSSAYYENDSANPKNIYGESKWLGEEAIRQYCETAIILRISGVFSEFGNNFLKTMTRLAKEKRILNIVADQITCPTYAPDVARVIFTLANKILFETIGHDFGTYHYCNVSPTSWYEFACAIIDAVKLKTPITIETINAIPSIDYPTPATRPKNSVLNCEKIFKHFGIKQAAWDKGIHSSLEQIN